MKNNMVSLGVVFTVQGGCIHGSPSICIGNAFFVLGKYKGRGQITEAGGGGVHCCVRLKYQRRVCMQNDCYVNKQISIIPRWQSKSNTAVQRVTCLNVSPQQFTSPDGDLGCFSKPHGALEARVNLSHLHGSFKANHLQSTVTKI